MLESTCEQTRHAAVPSVVSAPRLPSTDTHLTKRVDTLATSRFPRPSGVDVFAMPIAGSRGSLVKNLLQKLRRHIVDEAPPRPCSLSVI